MYMIFSSARKGIDRCNIENLDSVSALLIGETFATTKQIEDNKIDWHWFR